MGKNKKQSFATKALSTFTQLDMFGTPAQLQIDNQATYSGVCGTLASLLIILCVALYGLNRSLLVYTYGDTHFQSSTEKLDVYKAEDFAFEKTHFNLAFGIADYLGNMMDKEAYYTYFDFEVFTVTHNKISEMEWKPLQLVACNELDKQVYWPEMKDEQYENWLSKARCLVNPNDIKLEGTYEKEIIGSSLVV